MFKEFPKMITCKDGVRRLVEDPEEEARWAPEPEKKVAKGAQKPGPVAIDTKNPEGEKVDETKVAETAPPLDQSQGAEGTQTASDAPPAEKSAEAQKPRAARKSAEKSAGKPAETKTE